MTKTQRALLYLGFIKPTALEQAAHELEDAKRGLLAAAEQREYYSAIEKMMGQRIARLVAAIAELSEGRTQ